MKITGIVITLNEEKNITECIKSLQELCSEVIVVDSMSSDQTCSKAQSAGARVISQEYLGDGPQKQHAVPEAQHDWILSLDADERLSPELIQEIKSLPTPHPETAFSFPRKNYVGSHWIKAAGFYPDRKIRLFNRQKAHYQDKKHHAQIEAPQEQKLKGAIIHYTYQNMSHWVERLNWLSTRDAQSMFQSGKTPSKWRPINRAFIAFLRKFFFKGGFLQGRDGFLITATTTFRTYLKYEKLNELHESASPHP